MKLYNLNLSNFATKCRIVVFEKGANIELADIPGGNPKSAEYLKINPLGKIPALQTDDLVIAESEIINEYLEEKYPSPPLLPKSPEDRAKVRFLTRFNDLYLDPPFRALFPQLNPKTRDDAVVSAKLAELQGHLDLLEKILPAHGFANGHDFTLADCAIAPTMFFLTNLMPAFGAKPPTESRPKIAAWWKHVQTRPSVSKAIGEMGVALKAMMGGK
jgi:glutathione S-transferase